VNIFKRDATEEVTEEVTGEEEAPGSTGNRGRSLLVATGTSPPTGGTSQAAAAASPPASTYAFEFEIEGMITVGEFEAVFWASYAGGVFEANVTIGTPVTVGGVAFMIEGRGRAVQVDPMKPALKPPGTSSKRLKLKCDNTAFNFCFQFQLAPVHRGQIKLPCEEFGDIDVSASVQITEVSEDLQKSLGGMVGLTIEGSLVGDCSSTWQLELVVTLPKVRRCRLTL